MYKSYVRCICDFVLVIINVDHLRLAKNDAYYSVQDVHILYQFVFFKSRIQQENSNRN